MSSRLAEGDLVDGRYRILAEIGEGASKRVYSSEDIRLGRKVALATIKTEGLDEDGSRRLERELRSQATLSSHEQIVTILDVGESDDTTYVVSELMTGDLAGVIRTQKRLDVAKALSITDDVLAALEHAHSTGVIHRDVKPGNVWLSGDGRARLGDFGLAVRSDDVRVTTEGAIVGTVAYLAPECATGGSISAGPAADLYSVGAMCYEMLTGEPPFKGDPRSVLSRHVTASPVAPSRINSDIPAAVDDFILALLSKSPKDRPASAAEARRVLARLLAATGGRDHGDGGGSIPAPAPELPRRDALVGRDEELAAFRKCAEIAAAQTGQVLLISGEPGMGKTRLVEEGIVYAELRGFRVLKGSCYEGTGAPAFWPWIQVLRKLFGVEALASDGSASVEKVATELGYAARLLIDSPDLDSHASAVDPDEARFRLIEAVQRCFERKSSESPMLIFLDDLHWADVASINLFRFAARNITRIPVLLVGTFREEEIDRQHPLAEMLGSLIGNETVTRLSLEGIDISGVTELVRSRAPDASDELVSTIFEETGGNPYFLSEIVELMGDDPDSWSGVIPDGIKETIFQRVSKLDEECARALSVASVLGRDFDFDAVAAVGEFDADQLLDYLEEALAVRLLEEASDTANAFRFAHALVRETIYGEIPTTRRIRLHKKAGEHLEVAYSTRGKGRGLEGEIARHYAASAQLGMADKAVEYAERAAEEAEELFAYESVAEYYDLALKALGEAPDVDEKRCRLLIARGEAELKSVDLGRGTATLQEALPLARDLGDAELMARLALSYGGLWAEFLPVSWDLVELLRTALDVAGSEATTSRVGLLARLAGEYSNAPAEPGHDYESEARAMREEAVALADSLDDPLARAYGLIARRWLIQDPEHARDRLALAGEIIEAGQAARNSDVVLMGQLWKMVGLWELAEMEEFARELDAFEKRAEELGQRFHRFLAKAIRIGVATMEGRLAESEKMLVEGMAEGQASAAEMAMHILAAQMFAVRREQGRLMELEAITKSVADEFTDFPALRASLAFLYSENGRYEDAREQLEMLASDFFGVLPRNTNWLLGVGFLSAVAAEIGDTDSAKVLYELLLPYEHLAIVAGPAIACAGAAADVLGLLAATLGDYDKAIDHYRVALDLNTKLGARPFVAHTRVHMADALLARGGPGDAEEADGLLDQAIAAFGELGMPTYLEKAESMRAGIA